MNQIEQLVLRTIGEDLESPDVFVDSPTGLALIRGSINDALAEICVATGSYTRSYFLPLLEDRTFYRLNPLGGDQVVYVVNVWDGQGRRKLDQTGLLRLSGQDPWFLKNNGPQLEYALVGDVIAVYMAPSSKGKVLELQCVCVPRAYASDTDLIKVRSNFQRALVHYAVGEFYASRGDAARASEFHGKYIEAAGLMSLKRDDNDRGYQFQGRPWRDSSNQ